MRNILFTVLFIGILSLIASPISLASKSLHKANMINLSNNAIICMHQDPDGYLWIGTYDGLNLYNGKDTYVYRFELNNKNSLCSNIIHKISDAEPGFLWISTSLGINKFSLKKRKVTESYPGYMESDLVATDSSGITLAICKENRISCYTPFSDGFRDLPREGIGPQTVRTLFAGTDGYFYLLLTSGILKKLTPDFSNTTFNLLSEERQFHNKPILSAFYENNHIFIVDTDNKLYRQHVDGKGKEFLFDLPEMTKQYGNIIKICTFQSNVYIVFRNGNILDLSQPENTINMGIGIFCLMNDKKLTPEACDDLHFAIFEFNLQDKEYLCLLAMLDAIDISHWKRKYYSSQYAWAQWKLRISLKERKYISSAGTSGYPDAWDKFMQIWDTFTRLEALIALCRSRWTMDGTLTPLP